MLSLISPRAKQPRSIRKFIPSRRKLLGVSIGLIVGVVAAEMGLRVLGVAYPVVRDRHDLYGFGYIPNHVFTYRDEGAAEVRINQYGFRDEDRGIDKPEGVYRIAVLGDSFVDAIQVAEDCRFTELLETELNRSQIAGKSVEVLNFGTQGYGTAQELLVLKHQAWKFEPDLVILAVLTGNDIRNNHEPLQRDPLRAYFILRDGELILDDSFQTSEMSLARQVAHTAWKNSRLSQLALRCYRRLRGRQFNGNFTEPGLNDYIYIPPKDKAWYDAWDITERLLLEFQAESTKYNAGLLVVTLSQGIQVHPDRELRAAYMSRLGVSDLFYPDRRIGAFCKHNGISAIALAPELLDSADATGRYYHGFSNTQLGTGHWNEAGHEFAARRIAREIAASISQSR